MQVTNTLQVLFSQLAGQAKQSGQMPGIRSIAGPHVQLSLGNQSGTGHLFYTAQGQALQLGGAAAASRGQEIASQLGMLFGEEVLGKLLSLSKNHDAIIATLLQQSFQLIREELERDRRKKRRPQPDAEALFDEIEQSTEGEEQALELLEDLLDHASHAEDLTAFTNWARESINRIESELIDRVGELSEEKKRTFSIMRDALEALEHGMQPEYILDRLEAEIDRKK